MTRCPTCDGAGYTVDGFRALDCTDCGATGRADGLRGGRLPMWQVDTNDDALSKGEKIARKQHVCCSCGSIVEKGSRYLSGTFTGWRKRPDYRWPKTPRFQGKTTRLISMALCEGCADAP